MSRRIFTDNSVEFIKACQDLQWTHDQSTPYRLEANGTPERVDQRVKEEQRQRRFKVVRPNDGGSVRWNVICNVGDNMVEGKTSNETRVGPKFDGPVRNQNKIQSPLFEKNDS